MNHRCFVAERCSTGINISSFYQEVPEGNLYLIENAVAIQVQYWFSGFLVEASTSSEKRSVRMERTIATPGLNVYVASSMTCVRANALESHSGPSQNFYNNTSFRTSP